MFGGIITFFGRMFWNSYQNSRWNIIVPLFTQRGDSIIWDLEERGRLVRNAEGYSVIKLKKNKDFIKPPQYDVLTISKSSNSVYPLYTTSKGQYFSVRAVLPEFEKRKITKEDFQNPEMIKKIIDAINGRTVPVKLMKAPALEISQDPADKNWGILELGRIFSKYRNQEGWFAKYGQWVIQMIFFGVVIFMMIFMMSKFESVSSGMSSAANAIKEGLAYLSTHGSNAVTINPINATIVP
jgi:hypothetical protein